MTFFGSHNSSVVRLLLVLHSLDRPLSLKQLHELSGVPYSSLKSRLGFWTAIRYCQRGTVNPPAGKPYYVYSAQERGEKVLSTRIPEHIRERAITEINEWRKNKLKRY